MRVNVYAEEMTDRVEIVSKEVEGHKFTAVRFYLELPVTILHPNGGKTEWKGPFLHRPGDDDSSAVTFWGKKDLRPLLQKAIALLDQHYQPTCAECGKAMEKSGQVFVCPNCGASSAKS